MFLNGDIPILRNIVIKKHKFHYGIYLFSLSKCLPIGRFQQSWLEDVQRQQNGLGSFKLIIPNLDYGQKIALLVFVNLETEPPTIISISHFSSFKL